MSETEDHIVESTFPKREPMTLNDNELFELAYKAGFDRNTGIGLSGSETDTKVYCEGEYPIGSRLLQFARMAITADREKNKRGSGTTGGLLGLDDGPVGLAGDDPRGIQAVEKPA